MLSEYDTAWFELNDRLRGVEGNGGLRNALAELKLHQQRTGFIKDRLDDVERRTFRHPQNPDRFFRTQYNPKRALRFNGSGVVVPPAGMSASNDGCFLCRDNIRWQQRGSQMGYEIDVDGTPYYAWMNPFPLMPTHVIIATRAHTSQEWCFDNGGPPGNSALLNDLAALAMRLPGYVGFYNGVDAGASIPGHMHLHFCERPDDAPEFPLERAARGVVDAFDGVGFLTDYPVAVAVWRGPAKRVVAAASEWVWQWTERNRDRLHSMTGNFIVSADPDGDAIDLYFVPRDRSTSRAVGLHGLIGGLEILGEVVFSRPEDKELLDRGAIDYITLESYLARIHTPLFLS